MQVLGEESPLNRPLFRIGAWSGLAVLAAGVVLQLLSGRWGIAATLGLFLVLGLGFVAARHRLPSVFSLLFVLAALMNAAGWGFDWFAIRFYDPATHLYTTFAVALALGFLLYGSDRIRFKRRAGLFALAVGSLGLSLGAIWEIVEWVFGAEQTYRTVVIDLMADSVGALAAGALASVLIRASGGAER